MKAAGILLLAAISLLDQKESLGQSIVWNGSGDGASWSNPLNWVGGQVPGPTNAVFITNGAGASVVIVSDVSVESVVCNKGLAISNGSLTVTAGASSLQGALTAASGTYLAASGSNTTFTSTGPVSVDDANFYVSGGAVVTLAGLQNYNKYCNGANWTVTGANSMLSLPALTNFNGEACNFPVIQASAGAQILATNLAAIEAGPLAFQADGSNSLIDLGALSVCAGQDGYMVTFEASGGGTLEMPQMTGGPLVGVILNPGGSMPTAQIQTLAELTLDDVAASFTALANATGNFTINGETVNFPALTNFYDGNFTLSGGAVVTLPALRSYGKDCDGANWTVTGANSVLSLPALTNFIGAACNYPVIQAAAGGQILATNLASVQAGPLAFQADGSNSLINLGALSACAGQDGYMVTFEASGGGTLEIPQMTGGPLVGVILNPGGSMPTAQIQMLAALTVDGVAAGFSSLANSTGNFTITGETVNFPALTNFYDGNFTLSGGAVVTLPVLRSYGKNCDGANWTVTGPASVLNLPALTNLTGAPCNFPIIQAAAGGQILATNLASVQAGPLAFQADGSNSLINLSALASCTGQAGYMVTFETSSGGTLEIPNLTGGPLVGVILNPSANLQVSQLGQLSSITLNGGTAIFSALTNVSGGAITLNGGTASFPALSNFAGGAITASGVSANFPVVNNFDGGNISADGGAVVTLPELVSYQADCANITWLAEGGGSVVELAALTNLQGPECGGTMNIQALNGGQMLLSNLFSISGGLVQVEASGLNSLVNLENLVDYQPSTTLMNTTNGGVILLAQYADLSVMNPAAPSTAVLNQTVPFTFTIADLTGVLAEGPWQNQFLLATNPSGSNALSLGTSIFSNSIAGGSSISLTQLVILPPNVTGPVYLGVTVNSGGSLPEATLTNNTAFSPSPTLVTAADLALAQLSAPPSAQFGQSVSISFAVTNIGTASANATWNDQIFLSASSNSAAGATLLATIPGVSPLAPGAGYTRNQAVTLPLSSTSAAGVYYIVAVADAGNTQPESSTINNILGAPISLSLPGLPDLAVPEVVAPATALPGSNVTLIWTVTNQGTLNITNEAWSEAVGVSNAGGVSMLSDFRFTNSLNVGGLLLRTQIVTLPINTQAGNLTFFVTVNNLGDIIESVTGNDTTLATNFTAIPAALSLLTPVTSVAENTSAPNLSCLVSRNGNVTAPLVVSLAGSAASQLAVPASVTIPTGVSTAPFTATVLNDGLPGPNVLVSISANAGGYLGATSQVTVINTDVPSLAISLALPQITEGQTVSATVSALPVSNQPVVVSIASASTALAVPTTVTIPANSNSVAFPILAVQNTVIAPAQTYTISAFANGYATATTNLTVLNDNAPTLALSLDKTNINETDGPFAAIATVTRQPVTDQPVTVSLFSKNSAAALVPGQVIIPALTGSVTFYVAAVNDTNVTGPKFTVISAQALDVQGNLVGSPATETLAVQDNNGPALRVSIANRVVPKGLSPATTATVWTATPPTNNLLVTLVSSETNEATVPASVTILVGQTNAAFAINSLNDGVSNTSQTLSITANATNYASGSDVLTVTDLGLPDLVIANIGAPGAVFTAEPVTISFSLINQGLGELTNGVTQNVYFTTNPVDGNYLLMGSAYFSGPLAAGQYVAQSVVVPGSALPPPGIYWVVVTADANNNAIELIEGNNSAASLAPVAISPEYTATVHAGLTNVFLGTPVPLTGSAILMVGGPATNVPANLLLNVRGLQRIIGVYTDTNGNFSTVFTPLPNEAGTYTVSAVSPGITSATPQTQFNILGMSLSPASLALNVTAGGNVAGSVTLQNLSDVPLTNLSATVSGLAANLSASATLATNQVAGQGALTLSYNVTATNASTQQSSFTIEITSAQGVMLSLPVTVTVIPPSPIFVTSPAQLKASMIPGGQSVVQFEVMNVGGAASGPMTVNVPSEPWLNVASMNPLPALAPGQSNLVTLLLTPPGDLALGPYTGILAVNSISANAQVPFTFNAVSDANGALLIQSVDEYTFYSSNAPPLTNASVTLTDPFSGSIVASGATDSNGLFFVPSLLAGTYSLAVMANQHASFSGTAMVTAGQTNTIQTFLSLQTVTYTWSVVPTQIQDQTQITIQASFETDVPAPVVVPTPTSIDVSSLTQVGQFINVPLTLANYGLIDAQAVTISINSTPSYQFNIVTTNLGTLPAHGTVTVPMTITLVDSSNGIAHGQANDSANPCMISLGIGYIFPCGIYDVSTAIRIPVLHVMGDCGGTSYPGNTVIVGGNGCTGCGGDSGDVTINIPPSVGTSNTCNQCLATAIIECAIGYTPYDLAYSIWNTTASKLDGDPDETVLEKAVTGGIGHINPVANTACCLYSFLRCKCTNNPFGTNAFPFFSCVGSLLQQLVFDNGARVNDSSVGLGLSVLDLKDVYAARSSFQLEFLSIMVGDTDGRWFSPGSGGAFGAFYEGFSSDIQTNSQTGDLISPEQTAALMALPRPSTVADADVQNAVDRWNLSLSNWRAGIWSPTNVTGGGDTNFIDLNVMTNLIIEIDSQFKASVAAGYDGPIGGFFAALNSAESMLGSYTSGATCASIVLQIDQNAVLTLNAFHVTLQLDNNGADALTNVSVNLTVQNQAGQDVTSLFGLEPPVVSGSLTAVDGTGMLAASASGSAQWTLLPGLDAAPEVATNYLVGGSFSYVQNGIPIIIPLSPQPITVQPSPQLYLNYFLQRDVYGDDPFTPEIEPSIPFPLAVLVQNKGYGTANNFQIMSAQPTIVDNEKGLLINFDIIGAQVEGQPVSPSLTVNFGNILPGAIDIGVWYLTCSLEGLFTDYAATYQNLDSLGNPQLSPIQGLQIHQMTHMVQADGAWNDGEPDFLVQEMANTNNLPDTLYLSDGTVQPVSAVETATNGGPVTSGNLQVQFAANFPVGFTYVLVPDPANGQFPLQSVLYSNGANFLTNNYWVTDRTFIGLGVPPLLQTNLNLFVYHTNAGPDTFTLIYEAVTNAPQTNAPVSSVFSLPAQSPPMFGVVWSGESYVGQAPIAYYDIYVSDNGGPFTVWQSQTAGTGALYTGTPGHTYAFYSIATDTVGNREGIPLQPQAQTTVVANTSPPMISVASNATLNAGQTLTLNVTASDPNPLNTLTFSLGPGAPAGVVVNPTSGQITWATSPTFGGTTNLISVIVTDNGQPPLSATGMVTVIVLQVANPPVLAPIPNYTIYEGTPLIITNSATDSNLPPRTLIFTLGAGAPTNATIGKLTGIFQWLPTAAQAPSTNVIAVIVTDNGNPPLSATQQFTVIVNPVAYEFLLSFGYTNMLVGQSNSVAVTLSSQSPLTNITAVLQASTNSLTNLALAPVSPEVMGTILQPLGSNQYAIAFNLNPALSPGITRTLAQFSFSSVPQLHSSIVPLQVSQTAGLETGGLSATKPGAANGRVIIVGREPVLDSVSGTNSSFTLTIFGNIGSNYQMAFTTNLALTNWQTGASVLISNQEQNFNLPATNAIMYFRLQ